MKEDREEDRKQAGSSMSSGDGKRTSSISSSLDSSQLPNTTINSWPSRLNQASDESPAGYKAEGEVVGSTSSNMHSNISSGDENLEALQEERRKLHAYLKTYERDFNKTHGRPVMRHEDIEPVAHEYERYKNVK